MVEGSAFALTEAKLRVACISSKNFQTGRTKTAARAKAMIFGESHSISDTPMVTVWTNLCPTVISGGKSTCPDYGFVETSVNAKLLSFFAMAFWAQEGVEHAVQLQAGTDSKYSLHWEATSDPIIIQQPAERHVSVGDSALFKVMAMGLPPMQYQWTFQGVDLEGQTAPLLALDEIQADQAGDYTVRVASATGTVVSETARLTVGPMEQAPRLELRNGLVGGEFDFFLRAEPSRSYRIESSSDLKAWSSETRFPLHWTQRTSLVVATNDAHPLRVPRNVPQKYLRAVAYVPPNRICVNNLKQLRFAKDMWIFNKWQPETALPTPMDLLPYLKGQAFPVCPNFGLYWPDSIDRLPSCFYHGEILEEPRFP